MPRLKGDHINTCHCCAFDVNNPYISIQHSLSASHFTLWLGIPLHLTSCALNCIRSACCILVRCQFFFYCRGFCVPHPQGWGLSLLEFQTPPDSGDGGRGANHMIAMGTPLFAPRCAQ